MRSIVSEFLWCASGFGLVMILLLAFLFEAGRIPSDNELVRRFARDKIPLSRLVELMSGEPAKIVGFTESQVMVRERSNWVLPQEAQVSEEHFQEYQTLMKAGHVFQIWRYEDGIHFAVGGWGFASYGWRLDFTHTTPPPSTLVETLDPSSWPRHRERGDVYRPLGDDWYIRLVY